MYYTYTEEELRSYCRQSIESLEMWARCLIHKNLQKNRVFVPKTDKALLA